MLEALVCGKHGANQSVRAARVRRIKGAERVPAVAARADGPALP